MKLSTEVKMMIDSMTYTEMLNKWRFAPAGDPLFEGESGEYFADLMAERRASNPEEHVRASKTIGWERE